MAVDLVAASNQYLEYNISPAPAVPLSFSCMAVLDDQTSAHALVNIGSSTVSQGWRLFARGDTNDKIQVASISAGGTTANDGPASTYVAGTPFQAGATFSSNTSRIAWLNGVAGSNTNNASRTPTSQDRINVGCYNASGTQQAFADGRIWNVGIWNVVLTSAEMLALAAGYPPSVVRQQGLIVDLPCLGDARNLTTGVAFTVGGSATFVGNQYPTMFRRRGRLYLPAAVTAASGGDLSVTQDNNTLSATGTVPGIGAAMMMRSYYEQAMRN